MDQEYIIDCGFYIFYIKKSRLSTYTFQNKPLTIDIINEHISKFNCTYKYNKKIKIIYNKLVTKNYIIKKFTI